MSLWFLHITYINKRVCQSITIIKLKEQQKKPKITKSEPNKQN